MIMRTTLVYLSIQKFYTVFNICLSTSSNTSLSLIGYEPADLTVYLLFKMIEDGLFFSYLCLFLREKEEFVGDI